MSRTVLIAALSLLSTPALAEDVSVFAAASLKTALDQVAADYKMETGNDVTITYAGSNLLARQIIEGAPADIFISASTDWMDEVEEAGKLSEGTRHDLLGNELVLIAHDDLPPIEIGAKTDLAGMIGPGKLAMGLVDSVPAGQYGKAALEKLGLWDSVSPSVAQADNVRAALALVSTGEAPFGIVYATDAKADPAVHVIATFPKDSHPAITYPAALLTGAADPADKTFFEVLSSGAADAVFAAQGFTILN